MDFSFELDFLFSVDEINSAHLFLMMS